MIGQLLYLEAVSHSYSATGIGISPFLIALSSLLGCFLDDIVLAPFGLSNTDEGSEYAPLYNFSIGVPTGEKERYAYWQFVIRLL